MENIKRDRIKRRNNGLEKVVMVVENDPNGDVENIEVIIPAQNGVTAVPETITLEKRNTNANGNTRYVFRHLLMEGANPDGQIFNMTANLKDASGTTIATEAVSATAQSNDGINITGVSLRINDDGETFTFRTVVKGTDKATVTNIEVLLTPDDGGAEADPDQFNLSLTNETATKRVFKNLGVTFGDFDNVVDMEYIAAITLFDSNGEEIDYAEFRITGLE